jgi:hypothetical protein
VMSGKEIEIKLDLDVQITSDFSCVLIKELIDYLLHHRNQIPFNYELFDKCVRKKIDANDFKSQKIINLAKDTHARICDIKSVS